MEPNENQLSSYYHHHHHQSPTTGAGVSPTNGLLPCSHSGDGVSHMVYPHSVSSSAVTSPLEPAKRKRGRPRKYGTPEQALAAKKAATSSSHASPKEKKDHGAAAGGSAAAASPSYSGSASKKSQLASFGNSGQGFTPHVISVSAGEDVAQKIMLFLQQSKREMCILSAADGQIIGGGVGGPLKAAGPVQVIVGTFLIDTKKDANAGVKGDASGIKLPSAVGVTSPSNLGFRPAVDPSGRNPIRGNDDQQAIGGSHFMIQPRGMHVTPSRPTEWRPSPDARSTAGYELTGRAGLAPHQSPENGDYDQIPD
ncbi:hypothetical protein TIFTF001_001005 [Ficus carica]|uniref:AT-hook motif nuclear-localized protein n=1 Tax=Ficus carica TaxID=3494 RepID=A0AA88D3D2_FICCA|nr:hypothetical protein TIFTF001_001005 [Ficus carica]